MKKLITSLSVLGLLFVFGTTTGCGEQEYTDPGEVPEVGIEGVPPLGDEPSTDDSGDN